MIFIICYLLFTKMWGWCGGRYSIFDIRCGMWDVGCGMLDIVGRGEGLLRVDPGKVCMWGGGGRGG